MQLAKRLLDEGKLVSEIAETFSGLPVLQQFRDDNWSMASLRGLLTENFNIWRIGGMKEDAVIDQI